MKVTVWHNPRCSKSRSALKLIEERGIRPEVRLYLRDAPTVEEIRDALGKLGLPAIELVRAGEDAFREARLSMTDDDAKLIEAMAAHPILIERPVVFANGMARIGRPPEAVLEIL